MTSVIVSVQQGSITIASSGTSNTGSITPVTLANAVLFYQNLNTTNTATNINQWAARAELTNASTVTVSRGTSSATTETVYYTIVEFASAALATRAVQAGTITIASLAASGTASISGVGSTAVVLLLGYTSTTSGTTSANYNPTVTLTSTTVVTANRSASPSGLALTVGYAVIDLASANVQSIQARSKTLTSATTTDNDTISSVTQGNTIILFNGALTSATSFATFGYYVQLTSATNVLLTRTGTSTSTRTINYTVLEWVSGVLKSNVQRGTIALTSVTSNDATITSISTTYGVANYTGFATNEASLEGIWFPSVSLFSATDVRSTVNTSTATTVTVGYEAFEFSPPGTSVTIDGYTPGEFLASQQNDPRIQMEILTIQLTDRYLPVEALATQATNPSIRLESQATQRVDGTAPDEWTGLLNIDRNLLLESISTQQTDRNLPTETLLSQAANPSVRLESLATQVTDPDMQLENTGVTVVTMNGDAPFEFLSTQANDPEMRAEFLASLLAERGEPLENLASQRTDSNSPSESIASQKTDGTLQDEWSTQQAADRNLQAEAVSSVVTDAAMRDEALSTQMLNPSAPLENLATQRRDPGLPFENTGAIVVTIDALLPLEFLATQVRDGLLPLELLALTASDAHALAETLTGIQADRSAPLEILTLTQGRRLTPLEMTGLLSRDTSLPLESLATAFTVTSDAGLPFEILASTAIDAQAGIEALHSLSSAGRSLLEIFSLFPSGQIVLVVLLEDRTLVIGAEDRLLAIAAEDRSLSVPLEDRLLTVPQEDRTLTIPLA